MRVRGQRSDRGVRCVSPQAVQQAHGADAVTVQLGAPAGGLRAQLDGFKSRAVRATALAPPPQQQHLYVTDWRPIEHGMVAAMGPAVVVLGSPGPDRAQLKREVNSSMQSAVSWFHSVTRQQAAAVCCLQRETEAACRSTSSEALLECIGGAGSLWSLATSAS